MFRGGAFFSGHGMYKRCTVCRARSSANHGVLDRLTNRVTYHDYQTFSLSLTATTTDYSNNRHSLTTKLRKSKRFHSTLAYDPGV